MHRFSKIFAPLLCLCLLLCVAPQISAATPRAVIAFSSSTLSIGDTLTATVTFSADSVGAVDATVSYDSSVLEFQSGNDASGGGGVVRLSGYATSQVTALRFTLTFKALKAGSSTVAIDSSSLYSWDEQLLGSPAAGATVTVKDKSLSQNADLKSLSLSAGKLSPAFSAATTVYTATVSHSVTSVNISAVAADSGAKVTVSGSNALAVGANTRTVTVTAPGGAVKTYTVTVTRQQATAAPTTKPTTEAPKPPVNVEFSGKTYQAATPEALPDGFSLGVAGYGGEEIPAAKNESGSICLLWLTAEGESLFALYDEAAGTLAPYRPLITQNGTLYLLTPENPPADLAADSRTVADVTYDGWKFAEDARVDFLVVWGKTADGTVGWYCWDTAENTLQRYVPVSSLIAGTETGPAAGSTATKPTTAATPSLLGNLPAIGGWIAAGGLALICIALAVLLILSRRGGEKATPKH